MAPDQIYQPIVSDDDDQSETPSPRTELQIENPAEFRKKPDEGDDLTVEEATAQRSRRPDPESAESRLRATDHCSQGQGRRTDFGKRGGRCHALVPRLQAWRRVARGGLERATRSTRWRPT